MWIEKQFLWEGRKEEELSGSPANLTGEMSCIRINDLTQEFLPHTGGKESPFLSAKDGGHKLTKKFPSPRMLDFLAIRIVTKDG